MVLVKFGDILCSILFYSNPNCTENEAAAFRCDTHSITTTHEKDLGSESASSQLLLGASSQQQEGMKYSF